ncbi:MAG: SpoIIE family protein phosphatase [candidate division KSB1 bacterium]|nr:SpoIIE family protein phosphatase [candidate division KSB1 bacterium]MDZ7335222.1 SpoIIE family protein phosphatase [candidate division KSB1 bacterium]MDZ7357299.1 SpoIIE family protein phosphatase [candidate division KSB1 bacterium]
MKRFLVYKSIPAMLIGFVIIFDMIAGQTSDQLNFLMNLVVLLAIFSLMPWLQQFHQNLSIHQKDKLFLGSVAVGTILILFYDRSGFTDAGIFWSIPKVLVPWITVIALVLALTAVHDLIFVHRRSSTNANFFLLLVAIALYSLVAGSVGHEAHINETAEEISLGISRLPLISKLISAGMIYLMVINSFRQKWVKVLNKRQKLISLVLRLLVMAIVIIVLIASNSEAGFMLSALFKSLSVLRKYAWATLVFFFVYLVFSTIVLLLYLPTASIYDRKVKEISSLHQLSRLILGVFDIEQLAKIILSRTIEVTDANYAWLLLRRQNSEQFELVGQNQVPDRLLRSLLSRTKIELADWILLHREPLSIERISRHPLTSKLNYWEQSSGSLLVVPLIVGDAVIGLLFAVKQEEYGFLPDDKVILTAFANNASIAIENARLVHQSLEREKYEQELKIAHEAQMKLLPRTMPQLELLEMDAICIPANEVGGDYYDFFWISDHELAVVIGDVSGKGAEAAFYMAEAKGVLESLSRIYSSPKELLVQANKIFYKTFDPKTFFSAIYSVFNFRERIVRFARAGHCPLLHCTKNQGPIILEPPGLGLGLDPGIRFETSLSEHALPLQPSDLLFLYTDGLIEARNDRQMEFGEENLREIIYKNQDKSVAEIKAEVLKQIELFVGNHPRHDDLTMVVIKVR